MALFAHPGWIVLILGVIGVGLMLGSLVPVAINALRLMRHVGQTLDAPLVHDLEGLPPTLDRLSAAGAQVAPLVARAQAAVESIRSNIASSGVRRAIAAVKMVSLAMRLLARDLH